MTGLRQRCYGAALAVRAAGDVTEIFGRAVVYNQVAWGEVIRPGAFTASIADTSNDVKAYWSHRMEFPLGRRSNGTLTLVDTADALEVVIRPNLDTTWGRDALAAVQRGDVKHFSFGLIYRDYARIGVDGETVYEVTRADLVEVSPVADPWYDQTAASARAAAWEGEGRALAEWTDAQGNRFRVYSAAGTGGDEADGGLSPHEPAQARGGAAEDTDDAVGLAMLDRGLALRRRILEV